MWQEDSGPAWDTEYDLIFPTYKPKKGFWLKGLLKILLYLLKNEYFSKIEQTDKFRHFCFGNKKGKNHPECVIRSEDL